MKKINLSIPEPCQEDWDRMTQVEKGKFCSSCQKTVLDFTSMSDRELVDFFRKPVGSVCGRFHQMQLDRDLMVTRKRTPWIKYFFQFTWPAFILLLKSCGMKDKAVGKVVVPTEDVRNTIDNNPLEIATVGVLMTNISIVDSAESDEEAKVDSVQSHAHKVETVFDKDSIAMASIDISDDMNPSDKNQIETMVNSDTVVISQKEMDTTVVTCNSGERIGEVLAGAVSVRNVHPYKPPVNNGDRGIVKETTFSMFPNPVSREALLKINFHQLEKGEYAVLLVNNAGQVIHSVRAFVEYENQVISFDFHKIAAGVYYIQLVSQKSGKSHSGKLIVQ
jgi:hypothetical protein